MHTQIARTGFQQFQKPATRIFKMQNEILYSQIWTKKIWTFSFNETLKKGFSVYEFGLKVTDCCPGHNFPHLFLYLLLAFSFYVSVIFPLSGTSPWVTKHRGDKCFQVTSPVSGGQRERGFLQWQQHDQSASAPELNLLTCLVPHCNRSNSLVMFLLWAPSTKHI